MSATAGGAQPAVLALDQGGQSSRTLLLAVDGGLLHECHCSIATRQPAPDQVEHDGEELVASFTHCLAELAAYLRGHPVRVVAAGLATQRSSIICWDRRSGAALSPVLSWQDRRNAAWIESFTASDAMVHQRTGLHLTAHYGVSKLRWCEEHLPQVAQARCAGSLAWGPLASYLLFRLLRDRPLLVDAVNASRTLLWNLRQMDWDEDLLALFGVQRDALPRGVANAYAFGDLALGDAAVPMRLLTGDQPAALFAYGMPDAQAAYINMGTGAFVQRLLRDVPVYAPRLLTGIALRDAQHTWYTLEGTVNGAGCALVQLERELGIAADVAERQLAAWMDQCADPPLFLNGVSGLGSPFWQAHFPSGFVGEGSAQARLVAVAESILFLLRANLDEMAGYAPAPAYLVVTGGLALNDALCQRLADLTGLAVRRPRQVEATAMGVAWLLARQYGVWRVDDAPAVFAPRENAALIRRYLRWREHMPG